MLKRRRHAANMGQTSYWKKRISLYIPPTKAKLNTSVDKLIPTTATALATVYSVVIFGDFNTSYLQKPQKLENFEKQFGLKQTITEETHTSPTGKQSLIVHIYVRRDMKVNESYTEPGISDHSATNIQIKTPRPNDYPKYIEYRTMSNFNHMNFLYDLSNQPWENVIEEPDVTIKVEKFNAYFTNVLDVRCPLRRKKLKKVDMPMVH